MVRIEYFAEEAGLKRPEVAGPRAAVTVILVLH